MILIVDSSVAIKWFVLEALDAVSHSGVPLDKWETP